MLARIGDEFGPNVRRIVEACSDTLQTPKPPWRQRKEHYIASIPAKSPDELRVSLADKVYNARAILHDLNAVGERLWGRFSADRVEVLGYYRSLADAFARSLPGPLADELELTVDALERRVG
jgi:(p)ppGpp synthase/HD superfamily hydrolase